MKTPLQIALAPLTDAEAQHALSLMDALGLSLAASIKLAKARGKR